MCKVYKFREGTSDPSLRNLRTYISAHTRISAKGGNTLAISKAFVPFASMEWIGHA